MINQIFILLFGCTSIWMIGRKESWSKYGFIIGLCGQPFWIYESIVNHQWGFLILTVWYIYSWSQGIYNNFINK